ncbi:hypothetical protein CU098_010921 [Rhizopus stolonifer]|uniref:Uncharacterized protein n=1 Tax=Rhizopus stolonifer TaxID=4846 RepID=A0A367KV23_RHIST|nr:hypothetical protein CU098_010921 [Rhizopus stolonifer]
MSHWNELSVYIPICIFKLVKSHKYAQNYTTNALPLLLVCKECVQNDIAGYSTKTLISSSVIDEKFSIFLRFETYCLNVIVLGSPGNMQNCLGYFDPILTPSIYRADGVAILMWVHGD